MAGLIVKKDLCTGCLNCEAVCSLRHTGMHHRNASAIRVDLELFSGLHSITVCRQCTHPECLRSCPVDAIFLNEETGAWKIDSDTCIRCGNCISACPFGAMFKQGSSKIPLKCDLCNGEALCAEACKFGAITFKENQS